MLEIKYVPSRTNPTRNLESVKGLTARGVYVGLRQPDYMLPSRGFRLGLGSLQVHSLHDDWLHHPFATASAQGMLMNVNPYIVL